MEKLAIGDLGFRCLTEAEFERDPLSGDTVYWFVVGVVVFISGSSVILNVVFVEYADGLFTVSAVEFLTWLVPFWELFDISTARSGGAYYLW